MYTYNTVFDTYLINRPDRIDPDTLPLMHCKYVPLWRLDAPQSILDLLEGYPHNALVDVKVQDLKIGEHPCIPGWHCDARSLTLDEKPQDYYIIIFGNVSYTEFMLTQVTSNTLQHKKVILPEHPSTTFIKEGIWHRYNSFTFHRCTPAKYNGRRLLVRVCIP